MEEPPVLHSGRLAALVPGVYEQLITQSVEERLRRNGSVHADITEVPGDSVARPLTQHLSDHIGTFPGITHDASFRGARRSD